MLIVEFALFPKIKNIVVEEVKGSRLDEFDWVTHHNNRSVLVDFGNVGVGFVERNQSRSEDTIF